MNPGRSLLSEPSPYVAHEPNDGRPCRADPVYSSNSAGAWLNCSVYIDLMKTRSSAIDAIPGRTSDTHAPLLPRCENFCGVPSSFGMPDVNANVLPLTSDSGHGLSLFFTNSGL